MKVKYTIWKYLHSAPHETFLKRVKNFYYLNCLCFRVREKNEQKKKTITSYLNSLTQAM